MACYVMSSQSKQATREIWCTAGNTVTTSFVVTQPIELFSLRCAPAVMPSDDADAGADAGVDAGADAGADASADASADAGADA